MHQLKSAQGKDKAGDEAVAEPPKHRLTHPAFHHDLVALYMRIAIANNDLQGGKRLTRGDLEAKIGDMATNFVSLVNIDPRLNIVKRLFLGGSVRDAKSLLEDIMMHHRLDPRGLDDPDTLEYAQLENLEKTVPIGEPMGGGSQVLNQEVLRPHPKHRLYTLLPKTVEPEVRPYQMCANAVAPDQVQTVVFSPGAFKQYKEEKTLRDYLWEGRAGGKPYMWFLSRCTGGSPWNDYQKHKRLPIPSMKPLQSGGNQWFELRETAGDYDPRVFFRPEGNRTWVSWMGSKKQQKDEHGNINQSIKKLEGYDREIAEHNGVKRTVRPIYPQPATEERHPIPSRHPHIERLQQSPAINRHFIESRQEVDDRYGIGDRLDASEQGVILDTDPDTSPIGTETERLRNIYTLTQEPPPIDDPTEQVRGRSRKTSP